MMSTIGFLATLFLGFTLISGILGGTFLSANDTSILNSILVFRPMNVFGWCRIKQ